jgi:hypothetical protein
MYDLEGIRRNLNNSDKYSGPWKRPELKQWVNLSKQHALYSSSFRDVKETLFGYGMQRIFVPRDRNTGKINEKIIKYRGAYEVHPKKIVK